MDATKPVLQCVDVDLSYGSKRVLAEVNFELYAGELAVIIGPNGAGKSTLLKAAAGLLKPLVGEILYDGQNIGGMTAKALAARRSLVSHRRGGGGGALTVRETVGLGRNRNAGFLGRLSAEDKEIVERAMADTGIAHLAGRYFGTLSDGERQKTLIALALAQQTPLMLLDEPTAFLDVAARIDIMKLLRRLADNGRCIAISTHDIAPAIVRADKLIVVDPTSGAVSCGSRDAIIASGILDRVFADRNVCFNPSIMDFR